MRRRGCRVCCVGRSLGRILICTLVLAAVYTARWLILGAHPEEALVELPVAVLEAAPAAAPKAAAASPTSALGAYPEEAPVELPVAVPKAAPKAAAASPTSALGAIPEHAPVAVPVAVPKAAPAAVPKAAAASPTSAVAVGQWKSLQGLSKEEGSSLVSNSLNLEACQAQCDKTPACLSIVIAPGWCHLKDRCIVAGEPLSEVAGKSVHLGGDHGTWYKPCDAPPLFISADIPDDDSSTKAFKYKIFTFWDYPGGPDPLVALNIDSWRLHSPPGTRIVFVNDSNIREYVPDIPDEYFRLPYAAAKSDFVRSSVLFHQGGLYMDADFVVLGDLGRVFEKLDEGFDVVSYQDGQDGGGESGGDCGKAEGFSGFSSNFMAAKKENPLSRNWWSNVKHKMTRLCDEGEFKLEKICCHEAYAPKPERRKCHIPWGHLEWLKLPKFDSDAKAGGLQRDPTQGHRQGQTQRAKVGEEEEAAIRQAVLDGNRRAGQIPPESRIYCFRGRDGLAAHLNGEVYWQPWSYKDQATDTAKRGSIYEGRFDCSAKGSDLDCRRGQWGSGRRVFENFFGRIAYHLFFSTRKQFVSSKDAAIRQNTWLLSEMYRRALQPLPKKAVLASEHDVQEKSGAAHEAPSI